MKDIPSAKEFFIDQMFDYYKPKYSKEEVTEIFTSKQGDDNDVADGMLSVMVQFAKLHVKNALQSAYNNADLKEQSEGDGQKCYTTNYMGDAYVLDKDSILKSYPESNIK